VKLQGFRVLDESDMDQIHHAALHLLEHSGVHVLSQPALRQFEEAGAKVDAPSGRVRFPAALVEDSIAMLPSSFLVYDQTGQKAIEIGGRNFYAVAGMDGNYIFDNQTRTRRDATKQDVEDFARLADALPNVHFVSPQVIPRDVPSQSALLHAFEAVAAQSTKPMYISPGGGLATAAVLQMAQAVAGAIPLADHPILMVYAAPTSPLVWQPDAIESLIETVSRGVPLSMSGGPLMGLASPVTPAGTVSLATAEMLAGVVLACRIRKSPPIAFAAGPIAANMRTGAPCHGDPATMMARLAAAQMARYYRVPGVLSGPNTDSLCLDAQNGWESLFTTVTLLDSGCNILVNSGEFASASTASFEQLLLDNEVFGLCLNFLRGFEVNQDTLALDLIERLGPGASFLGEKHTYGHYSSDAWKPDVTCRESYVSWREHGAPDVVMAAAAKAESILSSHHVRSLPESTRQAMWKIREEFEEKISEARQEGGAC
jgi:trimethylamine--corrinoid protein Co-methyltransferase